MTWPIPGSVEGGGGKKKMVAPIVAGGITKGVIAGGKKVKGWWDRRSGKTKAAIVITPIAGVVTLALVARFGIKSLLDRLNPLNFFSRLTGGAPGGFLTGGGGLPFFGAVFAPGSGVDRPVTASSEPVTADDDGGGGGGFFSGLLGSVLPFVDPITGTGALIGLLGGFR